MPLVEKFQKCCQVRFGLVKRCWGTWSSPGLPRAWKSWPTIPGANAHNFTKSWWKPHGKMKDNKNGSQANYQFLGVISPDIVGGVLFFQGRPFRQNKGRLGPLSLYHGRLPLPGFGSINRFAIQKKKKLNMEPETKWTFQREIPISTSFLGGVLFQFQECWIWTSSVNPLEQAELRLEPPNQNSTGNVSSVGFDVRSCWWVPKIPQSFLQKIFLLQS